MANYLRSGQRNETAHSRRGFFTWIRQVTAGASVAGVGLSTLTPHALAATHIQKSIAGISRCVNCDGCQNPECHDIECQSGSTIYPVTCVKTQISGCAPNCHENDAVYCGSSCADCVC